MWKVVSASVAGTSHEADGRPCQDAHRVEADRFRLVAVCADGAGSASRAEAGSAAACDAVAETIRRHTAEGGTASSVTKDDAVAWGESARDAIRSLAEFEGLPEREYACTLLAVLADETGAALLQVGDGAIVPTVGGVSGVAFWPQAGEYAGTTFFLTGGPLADRLAFATSPPLTRVALFTDGLERLALRFAERTPHAPFFEPMFASLRAATGGGVEFEGPLRAFLSSDRVNGRTDDDKTLVLATREPPAPSPREGL